jgi:hypothetical protein
LEILLCIELGIRTSGVDVGDDFGRKIPKCVDHMLDDQQLNKYGCLTPSDLLKQEGWSKDTSQLPDIDVSSIKKYLINSKAQEFTVTSLRHYKLSVHNPPYGSPVCLSIITCTCLILASLPL